MDALSQALPQLLLVAFLLLIVMTARPPPPSFWRQLRGQLDQLGNELDRRFDGERRARRLPVYSAETVRSREAQFIRDRSPRKAPRVRFVLALLFVGVLVWALTR
jgi:hypothetical protein